MELGKLFPNESLWIHNDHNGNLQNKPIEINQQMAEMEKLNDKRMDGIVTDGSKGREITYLLVHICTYVYYLVSNSKYTCMM